MNLNLELKVQTYDDKMFFYYTHANKSQKFNHKIQITITL